MSVPPSGEQWTIAHGAHEATIVEVGGGIRTYRVNGVDVIAGYDVHERCSEGRGQVLMPWPNRIRDGRYEFDGQEHQLALSEPARGNASHGLVRWAQWHCIERSADAITVGIRLHPQPGWPGILDLRISYAVDADGLTVMTAATNVGDVTVPFGCGAHPYIALGSAPKADVQLLVPARSTVQVDPHRLLPLVTEPVTAHEDFRSLRGLAATNLDTAFTDLSRDDDGCWRVQVDGGAVPTARVWGDEAFAWVQVYTGIVDDDQPSQRRGIAIEPMSCPADAFNSGVGLITLAPGDTWTGSWGIEVGA